MKNRLSFSQAKQIPIVDYLSGLRVEPAYIRGNDYWYHSPFREERTPSFKVNAKLNVWFDHGTGEGGTILDLGAKLNQCSLQEFLEKLSTGNHGNVSFHQQHLPVSKPDSKLEIVSVNELTSPDLLQYLNSRGIDRDIAKKYCNEIEFRIAHKFYDAIGFQNQSGAYELRNRWFKGSSAPKDISIVNGEHVDFSRIAVLEGFMDFLSVLKIDQNEIKHLTTNSDFLILNSLRLLNKSLPVLSAYSQINLFLDNDLAALDAKDNLKAKGIRYHDASPCYDSHKDVNEFLMAEKKMKQGEGQMRRRSRNLGR